ncbi:MAG: laccase domain-containing protein [Deltaproteobacteria bacterium]|nr:laccase domain-containing protein [Deltaproteobacteria bacterium]
MILTSPLLSGVGVRHGFSTRLGGVSQGPGATFDLGRETRPDLDENRRRFALDHLHLAHVDHLHQVDQVHGITVVDETSPPDTKADGLCTQRPGHAVGVRTADCAPILIAVAAPRPVAVAALHAGWRGAVAGIVGVGIQRLLTAGARPEQLYVAIGPTISLAAFEVGAEVIEAATKALGAAPRTMISERGTVHLDLVDLLTRHLVGLGVPPAQIEWIGGCTASQPSLYFSYRRDRGLTGRHLSAIRL